MTDEFIAYGGFSAALALLILAVTVLPRLAAWWFRRFFAKDLREAARLFKSPEVVATQIRTWEHPTEGTQVEISHLEARR